MFLMRLKLQTSRWGMQFRGLGFITTNVEQRCLLSGIRCTGIKMSVQSCSSRAIAALSRVPRDIDFATAVETTEFLEAPRTKHCFARRTIVCPTLRAWLTVTWKRPL